MKIVFIRHGEPDYRLCEERHFIGHGLDLAPLSEIGEEQAKAASENPLLDGAQLIVASPYTRALQTAAIIAGKTGLPLQVEMDLYELIPDKTFQVKSYEEVHELHIDFQKHRGEAPEGEEKRWEGISSMIKRVVPALEKYLNYQKIIVVAHGGVIRRFTGKALVGYGVPYEVEFEKGFSCYRWCD